MRLYLIDHYQVRLKTNKRRINKVSQQDNPVGLLSREKAIDALVRCGFSVEEAAKFAAEPDQEKRIEISQGVQQRLKGGTIT